MLTQLKHIGLSNNEAKVYLAMLELGPSPVLDIAAKAAINRPTTYVQIELLKKKGLVSIKFRRCRNSHRIVTFPSICFLLGLLPKTIIRTKKFWHRVVVCGGRMFFEKIRPLHAEGFHFEEAMNEKMALVF